MRILARERLESFGHYLISDGNYPVKIKNGMITDWVVLITGPSIHSFVGLFVFYHKYTPYLDMWIKPSCQLIKKYFNKVIPILA